MAEEEKENSNALVETVKDAAKSPEVQTIGGIVVAGTIIGSFVPVIGTGIGAGVGAILGGIGVIARTIKKKKEEKKKNRKNSVNFSTKEVQYEYNRKIILPEAV